MLRVRHFVVVFGDERRLHHQQLEDLHAELGVVNETLPCLSFGPLALASVLGGVFVKRVQNLPLQLGALVLPLAVAEHAIHIVAHKFGLVGLREALTCQRIVQVLFQTL